MEKENRDRLISAGLGILIGLIVFTVMMPVLYSLLKLLYILAMMVILSTISSKESVAKALTYYSFITMTISWAISAWACSYAAHLKTRDFKMPTGIIAVLIASVIYIPMASIGHRSLLTILYVTKALMFTIGLAMAWLAMSKVQRRESGLTADSHSD